MISRALRVPVRSGVRGFSSARCLLAETKRPDQGLSELKNEVDHQEAPVDIASGAPKSLSTDRVVRIYQQAKPATQSGTWGTHAWRIDWDIVDRANRWENDLMGWASSGDYM
ncbi:hypothetical protein TRICI_003326 [Trichomonascus ciferrii]|uniref:NADH dehydrogenase [ubiquinone] iron-sulfur protein 4, mitochondrial n=1 Tax=Trichomonascus ciferrii TaxID=44093 RepID=A0A642V443_9ASCO|nr:hypothetical protein TRICI_003326 [Trichomonascus ciferrii]